MAGSPKIALSDIAPALARRSGFTNMVDLLKIAKRDSGQSIYLVDFEFEK